MKTEIPLLSVVIAAVIYACGVFILTVYIVHSLALATMKSMGVVEELEMLF